MSLKDIHAATKFVKVFARTQNVNVVFNEGLTTPYAALVGGYFTIHLAPPTLDGLLDWMYRVHHELSHVIEAHRYHYDAVGLVMERARGEADILNIICDNIVERYEYTKYEGRRHTLCHGRFNFMKGNHDRMNVEPKSVEEEVMLGLFAWDVDQRCSWMGYPFDSILSLRDKNQKFLEYLETNRFDDLINKQQTPDDLMKIVKVVMDYLPKPTGDKQDGTNKIDDSKDGKVPDSDGDDGASDDTDNDSSGDQKDSEGKGMGSPRQAADGGDGADNNDSDVDGDNTSDSTSDTLKDKQDDDNKDDGKTRVPPGADQDQGPKKNDGSADSGQGDKQGSDSDGDGSDSGSPSDDGSRKVESSKPCLDEGNIRSDIVDVTDSYLMKHGIQGDTSNYVPYTQIDWRTILPTNKYKRAIYEKIAGKSTVSKSIAKFFRAMQQSSYQYGMTSGRVSNKSIYKTGHGGRTIFKQKKSSRYEKSTAVQIMVDCSASMNGLFNGYSKQDTAMAAVGVLSGTLYSLAIPHEILGFTEDVRGVKMIEFKSFAETINKSKVLNRLSGIPYQKNNADGESLMIGASRLDARKERNKIMLVLSDGNPNTVKSKAGAVGYLKQVCKHLEDDTKINLLGVGIHTDSVRSYYKNYEVVYDIEKLDETLMRLLKNTIMK